MVGGAGVAVEGMSRLQSTHVHEAPCRAGQSWVGDAECGDPRPPSVALPQAHACQDEDVLGPGSLHAILRLTSSLVSSPSDPPAGPVVPPPGSVPNLHSCPLHPHSASITWTSAPATLGSLGSFLPP